MNTGAPLTPPLDTTFARVLLVAFAIVHTVLAAGPSPTPVAWTVLALITMTAAAARVVLAPGAQMGTATTGLTVVLTVVSTTIVIPWLPGGGWPGYASWPLGAGMFVAIALTLRQRIGAAWCTAAALTALCLVWGARSGDGIMAGVGLIDRQLGVLVLGTLFAIGLGRAGRTTDQLAAVERRELVDRDRAETELRIRADAVRRVLAEAGPTLERIAEGGGFLPDERRTIIALEGRLRDRIVLAPLLTPTLEAATSAARVRGIDVLVLADPGIDSLPADDLNQAAAWLASHLDRARGDEFVARVVLRDGETRVSTTVDGDLVDVLRLPKGA